ncbi:MAG: transketolase C-terminal domain-containing protein, partial [Bacteroidota bacterium]|nr:transketolase C-terminal domain-containing protein [Bacteroidota bacterium]
GAPVHWAIEVLNEHKDWSVELIDLRSLIPLDYDTIKASVAKTGKVLLVTEDVNFGSITADISAYIADECFICLDAPIKRLSSIDTPIPFAQPLENQYLAKRKLAEAIEALLAY